MLGVERRNTQRHSEHAQAAMSSRSIVANPYLRDLVPHPNVHRQVSMDAQVVDGAGANSSISRTRKLADYDRLSTLVAGIEERTRRSCLNRDDKDMRMSAWRRQTARATGQGRDRARAGSPGSFVTYGARRQTYTRENQRRRSFLRPPPRPAWRLLATIDQLVNVAAYLSSRRPPLYLHHNSENSVKNYLRASVSNGAR